jgi:hypothetical protein
MGEGRGRTAARGAPARVSAERTRRRELLARADQVWPASFPQREVAGLPPWAAEVIRPGRGARRLQRAAAEMDRALPGWTEQAAEVVCHAPRKPDAGIERVCALLAYRPLRHPEPLVGALEARPYDPDTHFRLLTALSGTDTAAVRTAWREELERCANSPALAGSQAAWYAFARAAQGEWLTFREFRDALTAGRALEAAGGEGGYRPALERLGLWPHPTFAKWYRQVVYEVATQPDVALSLTASGWITDFPGEDYLLDALQTLEHDPESWWALHLLRWSSGVSPQDRAFLERVRELSPHTLCLLSLVRPDLSPAVGEAWLSPTHEEVIRWLTSASATSPMDLEWSNALLRPWAEAYGGGLTLAVGALCAVEPPADFLPGLPAANRRRAFHAQHFGPAVERALENFLHVLALTEANFELVCEQAKKGRATAVRALALRPDRAEQTAPLLFELTRRGRRQAREAARDTLALLAARSGLHDLARLEQRVDLAAAWSEEEEGGRLARVWWEVAGYHVRLAVLGGEVKLRVYSGAKQLEAMPARLRRDPAYTEIHQRREELAQRYRYFRRRLEQAMVEGVAYPGREFAVLLSSPVVRSLVSRLMLWVDGQPFHWASEDPLEEGEVPREITGAARVSVAHPVALSAAGQLEEWQRQVVATRLEQPFKQAFREIYLLGGEERGALGCVRFADRPLHARRAFALLRQQGYNPRHGDAVKEWPGGVGAHLEWAREEEAAGKLLGRQDPERPVTSGQVWFSREDGQPLPLGQAPPVIFSETLRDADLTVSLASYGELGFTSEETRRLRATLVRYLARTAGLTTVYVGEDYAHAVVEGARAMYRVHLGSGSVLLEQSRRHLHIGPDLLASAEALLAESMDKITAHIVSLVLTLSQDDRITDPHFLGQLGEC